MHFYLEGLKFNRVCNYIEGRFPVILWFIEIVDVVDLVYKRGKVLGRETRGVGIQVLRSHRDPLGPVLMRSCPGP